MIMLSFQWPQVVAATAGLVLIFIFSRIRQFISVYQKRQALKRQRGVLPAPWLDQSPLLRGFDNTWQAMRALRKHQLLERLLDRTRRSGKNTLQMYDRGRHAHYTIEPGNLKTMQALDHQSWNHSSRRKAGLRPLLGKGIFTTDGAEWQHSRALLRPCFSRSQIADVDFLETHVSHLIAQIPRDATTIDLSELFFRLTMDSATEYLFGESTNSLSTGTGQGFADAFARAQQDASDRMLLGWWYNLMPGAKRAKRDIKFIHDFVDRFVDKGLARRQQILKDQKNPSQTGRYVFLDELVRQTDDRLRIRNELLNILLAGRDTTASFLTNIWFTLGKRPDIWQKLQAEVGQLNGKRPSFEQIKHLKYVRALLNESLRLYPIVPWNSREAREDTILPLGGGPDGSRPIFIKKGELVSWSVFAMHRRQDFYGQDADEFKPERWLDDPVTGKSLRPTWEYLPFNGGARICLGQQFALTEASYVTIRLCQEFDGIESRDPDEWQEGLTLTLSRLPFDYWDFALS